MKRPEGNKRSGRRDAYRKWVPTCLLDSATDRAKFSHHWRHMFGNNRTHRYSRSSDRCSYQKRARLYPVGYDLVLCTVEFSCPCDGQSTGSSSLYTCPAWYQKICEIYYFWLLYTKKSDNILQYQSISLLVALRGWPYFVDRKSLK